MFESKEGYEVISAASREVGLELVEEEGLLQPANRGVILRLAPLGRSCSG